MGWYELRGINGLRFLDRPGDFVLMKARQTRTWRGRKFNFWW